MPIRISGTSLKGNFNEALNIAIESAKRSLSTDYVNWSLFRTSGDDGGFVLNENLTVTIWAYGYEEADGSNYAFFQVRDASNDIRPFIIKMTGENVGHARRILSGGDTTAIRVQGKIVKGSVFYNSLWRFHLDPSTIEFFENAVEVCDATMTFVEQNLDEVGNSILPDGHWCPWSSHIVAEIPID